MIYESLGAVCGVESLGHPCQQFVDDLGALGSVCAVESVRHQFQQFVDDL
jgi:hypothetical protein